MPLQYTKQPSHIEATHDAFLLMGCMVCTRADYRAELTMYRARVQAVAEQREHIAKSCAAGLPPALAMRMLNATLGKEPTCPNHPDRRGVMPGGICAECYFELRKKLRRGGKA